MNTIMLMGRVAHKPYSHVDGAVMFTCATERKDAEGIQVRDLHTVVCEADPLTLEGLQEALKKDAAVMLHGEIRYDWWVTEAGEKRRSARVYARRVSVMGDGQ